MRYKILNKPFRNNEKIIDSYHIMKEIKPWYSKKLKWIYMKERDCLGDWTEKTFDKLKEAENYITQMIKSDNAD